MSEELELKLLREIEELKNELKLLKGESKDKLKQYSYSKMDFKTLKELFNIKKSFIDEVFKSWFDLQIEIKDEDLSFLKKLLQKYGKFIKAYKEETLKANFIIPIINRVDFLNFEKEISSFYEEIITYKTDDFILSGSVDFVLSRGLEYSEKPYFFIQEFKRDKESSDPEPQLLAEMIAGVELNSWKQIKGAYIVGSIWNFVILEKIEDRYIYYISANFDSSKINDLIDIYKNLMFVKEEILKISEID